MKKTIISFLACIILIVNLSGTTLASTNQLKCLNLLKTIADDVNTIEYLVSFYEEVIRKANDPFHAEYRERYLEMADDYLDSISKYMNHIKIDSKLLLKCEGLENLSYEEMSRALNKLFLLMNHPLFSSEELKLTRLNYYFDSMSIINSISKITEREGFEQLQEEIFGKHENTILDIFKTGLDDKFKLRIPSLTANEPTQAANIMIAIDGLDTLRGQIIDFFNSYKEADKRSINASAKDKTLTAGYSSLKGISVENVLTMGVRSLYYAAYKEMLMEHSDPSQAEFRDEMAQNFASISVATTPIAFGAAVGEATADMLNHVGEELQKINETSNKTLQEYYRKKAEQKMELLNATLTHANKVYKAKFSPSVSTNDYVSEFNLAFNEFEKDLKAIYNLDPNEIKIYIDGFKLNIPEPVYMVNGTTMVPLRVISETLSIKTVYNSKTGEITITNTRYLFGNGKNDIIFKIGSQYYKRGKYTDTVPVAPTVKNGVTFIPLRAVAQELALDVYFDKKTNSIILTSLFENTKLK